MRASLLPRLEHNDLEFIVLPLPGTLLAAIAVTAILMYKGRRTERR